MKLLNKTLLLFLLFQFPSEILFSQDSSKCFITYDVFKAFINEHSFTFGYNLTRHHFITVSLGYTYANKGLRESIIRFSPSQDEYPVLVNMGPVIRAGYDYRVKPFFYFGADICYKYLHYSNHTFQDSNGKDESVWYTRDEKSNVFVGHINLGFMFIIPNTPILINPSVGIGGKLKYRNCNTYDVIKEHNSSFDIYPGTSSKKQDDFSVIINMNIGINIGKR